ncbi:putative Acyl carrier protein (ACP) [Medicago truncatula]|uniref:Acyl carrier protein n=1 Tax=Medicago truncatula TaxID=3880 RepID=A0A072VYB1_MEDTR|nr:acyl carrier protein [Medicago truncatula]RHN80714.1 putative Acyl carrier protein (ACP) [Medicago truncatula]
MLMLKCLVLVQAKPQTVQKVCKIVKKQLGLPDYSIVTGSSKFAMLGVDTVEILMELEEEFGISVELEEDIAESISTVQEAAESLEEKCPGCETCW